MVHNSQNLLKMNWQPNQHNDMKHVHPTNINGDAQIMQHKSPLLWFSHQNHNINSKVSPFTNGVALHHMLIMEMCVYFAKNKIKNQNEFDLSHT
jgi:hypothetical protein